MLFSYRARDVLRGDGELAQVAEYSKNSRSALNVFDYERNHLTNALPEVKNGL